MEMRQVEMPRYYFHFRHGDEFTPDDVGLELDGIERAVIEAMRGLSDFAREVGLDATCCNVAIEVVDAQYNPRLTAKLILEVDIVDRDKA